MPPRAHERDLADLPGVEILLLRLQIVPARSLLHAHLADAVVHPRRLDDRRALLDRQRQRLLDVDVLAGRQRVERDWTVPVIRHGDEHRVDVLLVEERAMVFVGLRALRRLLSALDLCAVDVAETDEVRRPQREEIGHVADAARAASNQPHAQPILRAQNARRRQRRRRGRRTNSLQKIPTIRWLIHARLFTVTRVGPHPHASDARVARYARALAESASLFSSVPSSSSPCPLVLLRGLVVAT